MSPFTRCCQALATYHDDIRCCKVCWEEVPDDEGDGEPDNDTSKETTR